jgi:hypothetical protein
MKLSEEFNFGSYQSRRHITSLKEAQIKSCLFFCNGCLKSLVLGINRSVLI